MCCELEDYGLLVFLLRNLSYWLSISKGPNMCSQGLSHSHPLKPWARKPLGHLGYKPGGFSLTNTQVWSHIRVFYIFWISLLFQVWSYLGFSVTAAIFSGIMIIMYSLVLAYSFDSGSPNYYLKDGGVYYYGDQAQSTRITISAVVLFLAVVEFGVSIWSAITCCQANGCVCCQNATQVLEIALLTCHTYTADFFRVIKF